MKKILYFWGEWCNPCKTMSKNIEKIIEGGILVEKLDVMKHRLLAGKFGIMSVPTIVIMEGDKAINMRTGLLSVDAIQALVH